MPPTADAAFLALRETLRNHPTSLPDLLDGALVFLADPQAVYIGIAILSHMRDILAEGSGEPPTGDLFELHTQMYWRTFCAPQYASRYGTDHIANDANAVAALLEGVTQFLATPQPDNAAEQLRLTLSTGVDVCH